MTRFAAERALRGTLLTRGAAQKFTKFGVQLLALRDELLGSRDLAVYIHTHHLLS